MKQLAAEQLPFHKAIYGDDELRQIADVLQSGWLTRGPKTAAFEEAFSAYIGCRYAIGVNSATAGLHLALVALDIGAGDEVITTPITYCATANEIEHAGAVPVFADVDPQTYLIDPDAIEAAITPRTKAIMPVHLYGQSADMERICAIARRHDLKIIEDAAHAIETTWHEQKIGTIGDATVFSFYATKNMSTGEGGMITTNDSALAERMHRLAMHGLSRDAWQRDATPTAPGPLLTERGYKCHMFDLIAALGLAQLPQLESWWLRRRMLWQYYDELIASVPGLRPVAIQSPGRHAYHLYVVEVDAACGMTRDALMQALTAQGIGVGLHYLAMHLQPYYAERYGFEPEQFPHAADASRNMLTLPLYPRMERADVRTVIDTLKQALNIMPAP